MPDKCRQVISCPPKLYGTKGIFWSHVSGSKSFPKHLGQGSGTFPPTVQVFILEKEQSVCVGSL